MNWFEGALLCGGLLASTTLAIHARWPRDLLYFLLGLALMGAVCVLRPPSSTLAGVWIAGSAAWALRSPGTGIAVAAGGCAALGAANAVALGLSWWIALPASAVAAPLSMWLARVRENFAAPQIADEALCALVVTGLVFAAVAPVTAGWQTAQTLNMQAGAGAAHAAPTWVWTMVWVALTAGAAGGLWKRR